MSEQVNHPAHYNVGIECIEVIRSLGWWKPFCLSNVLKYVMRAGEKDPAKEIEDLQKASWYLDYVIERLKAGDGEAKELESTEDLNKIIASVEAIANETLETLKKCYEEVDKCKTTPKALSIARYAMRDAMEQMDKIYLVAEKMDD